MGDILQDLKKQLPMRCSHLILSLTLRLTKENNLQDPDDKLMIKCDKKLEAMTKKSRVSGKEIPKIVTQHLTHDPDMEVR